MNPKCAKCSKTVYPTEKLSCLDKQWHKGCFVCETCGLKLTMKTYKGYNKRPYCNAHYPTTKFTAVADTPENLRLKKQTNNQSQIAYHADHKANLAKFTAVPDDGRQAAASQQASQLSYQGSEPPNPPRQYGAPTPTEPARPPTFQPPLPTEPARPPTFQPPPSGRQYVAVYDYAAADDDEASFVEGDIIVNVEIVDEGWMTGTVKRTGQSGMLPANYIEVNK